MCLDITLLSLHLQGKDQWTNLTEIWAQSLHTRDPQHPVCPVIEHLRTNELMSTLPYINLHDMLLWLTVYNDRVTHRVRKSRIHGTARRPSFRWHGFIFPLAIRGCHKTGRYYRFPRQQGSWGQHGAHLGPVGPRLAPWWPHVTCYQVTMLAVAS